MKKETLKKATKLEAEIAERKGKINILDLALKASKRFTTDQVVKIKADYYDTDTHGSPLRELEITFELTPEEVVKRVKKRIYVNNNLIKKLEKELERL